MLRKLDFCDRQALADLFTKELRKILKKQRNNLIEILWKRCRTVKEISSKCDTTICACVCV